MRSRERRLSANQENQATCVKTPNKEYQKRAANWNAQVYNPGPSSQLNSNQAAQARMNSSKDLFTVVKLPLTLILFIRTINRRTNWLSVRLLRILFWILQLSVFSVSSLFKPSVETSIPWGQVLCFTLFAACYLISGSEYAFSKHWRNGVRQCKWNWCRWNI